MNPPLDTHKSHSLENEEKQVLKYLEGINLALKEGYPLTEIHKALVDMDRVDLSYKVFRLWVELVNSKDEMEQTFRTAMDEFDKLLERYHSYNRPYNHNLPHNCYQITPQPSCTFNNDQNIKMTFQLNSEIKKKKKMIGVQAIKNHEQEIRDLLSTGISLKIIYDMIKDPESMPIAYSTFQKYAKKYIFDLPEPKEHDYQSKYHKL